MEIIKEYWFMFMFLFGVAGSLAKSLFDLNKTISNLGYGIERLNENFKNVEKAQAESKDEIDEHQYKLSNHETRITVLERTRRENNEN